MSRFPCENITGRQVVLALQAMKRSVPATEIAEYIGYTDARAVATAARQPVKDGRITMTYRKPKGDKLQRRGFYRFVRLKPRSAK